MKGYRLLHTAIDISSLMLSCGGELYRAEESIVRICKAYGATEINVFSIPSSLIVTLVTTDNKSITLSKKVVQSSTDLNKLDRLNNLSRYICDFAPDYNFINSMLNDIENNNILYDNKYVTFSFAIIPGVFCLFFGGTLKDAFFTLFIGITLKFFLNKLEKQNSNLIFINIICSAIASVMAILFTITGLADNYDKMIIGSIMLLVPGLILTNAMRDLMLGDMLTGILRLIEALLVAVGIAIGVAIILSISGLNKIS